MILVDLHSTTRVPSNAMCVFTVPYIAYEYLLHTWTIKFFITR